MEEEEVMDVTDHVAPRPRGRPPGSVNRPREVEPAPDSRLLSGRRYSEEALIRAQNDAMIIPTNAEEYRKFERATAILKAAAPRVRARVVRTAGATNHVAISADDLAGAAPGGMSQKFKRGDEVILTADAAPRLVEQGWVELI
jgi:hypothetical protein